MDIKTRARWALGVFAVALLVGGAAATVAGREVVATALLTGGIVLVLVTLAGRLPTEFTMGGVSWKYREMAREDFAEGVARAIRDYTITYRGDIVKRDREPPKPEG